MFGDHAGTTTSADWQPDDPYGVLGQYDDAPEQEVRLDGRKVGHQKARELVDVPACGSLMRTTDGEDARERARSWPKIGVGADQDPIVISGGLDHHRVPPGSAGHGSWEHLP
jgi:hypothetical protein